MNQETFRKIVAGEDDSFTGRFMRRLLGVGAVVYSWIIKRRNRGYDRRLFKTYRMPVPVISVGNITAGGTGKTPIVIWICNYLLSKDLKTAILTRGYGSSTALRDEPAVFASECPRAKVIINADRVAGAATAIEHENSKVLVMDDGFQHRRLARDIDVLAIDSMCPFGYGKLLPAGLLREPVEGIRRAQAAILTRCDLVEERKIARIEQELRDINPLLIMARAIHKPLYAQTLDGHRVTLEELRGKKVLAFCGIGNPEAFFGQLVQMGCEVVASHAYDDHRNYNREDIEDICEEAKYLDAELVLTTQKDWVKVAGLSNYFTCELAYLGMALEFVAGEDKIIELIESKLKEKRLSGNVRKPAEQC